MNLGTNPRHLAILSPLISIRQFAPLRKTKRYVFTMTAEPYKPSEIHAAAAEHEAKRWKYLRLWGIRRFPNSSRGEVHIGGGQATSLFLANDVPTLAG